MSAGLLWGCPTCDDLRCFAILWRYIGTAAANAALILGFLSAIFFAFHEAVLGTSVLSPLSIIPVSFLVTIVLAPMLGLFNRASSSTEAG